MKLQWELMSWASLQKYMLFILPGNGETRWGHSAGQLDRQGEPADEEHCLRVPGGASSTFL